MAEVAPSPEDSALEAFQKLYPRRTPEVLRVAATWLGDNFGVATYADLEGADVWAEAGKAFVADDNELNAEAKGLIYHMLGRLTGEAVGEDEPEGGTPAEAASCAVSVAPVLPKALLAPEDSALEALQKLFPHRDSEVLEQAAAWLNDQFGVLTYADLEGATVWGESGKTIVAEDDKLSASVKGVLYHVLREFAKVESPADVPEVVVLHECPGGPGETLQEMFPGYSSEAARSAAAWLKASFGVDSAADLEDAATWADAAQAVVKEDTSLAADTKALLREFLGGLAGASAGTTDCGCGLASADATGAAFGCGLTGPRSEDFCVLARLGEGSFAFVYKVERKATQIQFALKEIDRSKLVDPTFRSQIHHEAEVHRSLVHPHILRCHESFEDSGSMYLVLELAEGGDLYKLIQKEKVLSEAESARLFSEAAAAIHYLHFAGVMHRDLKPENIFLDEGRHAKIADFGWCARTSEKQTLECGSIAYFAPEMVAGNGYDHRVDTWAIGVLLYEMLVGYSPFSSALAERETKRRILNMDFGYGAWYNVPSQAQPLLKLILLRDPGERLPLREALGHEWVVSHVGSSLRSAAEELEQGQHDGSVVAK
eukprot:TRINITY_DN18243_c0_g2_i1.p1 TRINITY_DN18243_c0_g2~~TRINITY_DN18243_c0_g2_i1.p1  ORF type:complete len:600 (-),score=106.07 TRINITY_DN18243_c0_g2_i1:768-2567(-)